MHAWFMHSLTTVLSKSVACQLFGGPFYSLLLPQYTRKENGVLIPLSAVTEVWHKVDTEVRHSLSFNQQYWWRTSGYALAVLLYNAGYSSHAQYQTLTFFAVVVAPSLGAAFEPSLLCPRPWGSFMTDDGNPIELSWDWGIGNKPPTIRFSIEPVGVQAGTPRDPQNLYATSRFRQTLLHLPTKPNVEWFDHFNHKFNRHDVANDSTVEGHSSQVFFAFDLAEEGITSKAYFFPGFNARATGQTNLAVISQTIVTAPYCTTENLGALSVFEDFATDPSTPALEMDMLAIDLIEPTTSRLKIYFRSRETTFSSVRHIMTLGKRTATPEVVQGLNNLKRLWDAVLEREDSLENEPLPSVAHRTAGILYNAEFCLGSVVPKVKIYIPVRHYASSDQNIIRGLGDYLYGVNNTHGARCMPGYVHALGTVL